MELQPIYWKDVNQSLYTGVVMASGGWVLSAIVAAVAIVNIICFRVFRRNPVAIAFITAQLPG